MYFDLIFLASREWSSNTQDLFSVGFKSATNSYKNHPWIDQSSTKEEPFKHEMEDVKKSQEVNTWSVINKFYDAPYNTRFKSKTAGQRIDEFSNDDDDE